MLIWFEQKQLRWRSWNLWVSRAVLNIYYMDSMFIDDSRMVYWRSLYMCIGNGKKDVFCGFSVTFWYCNLVSQISSTYEWVVSLVDSHVFLQNLFIYLFSNSFEFLYMPICNWQIMLFLFLQKCCILHDVGFYVTVDNSINHMLAWNVIHFVTGTCMKSVN